MGDTSLQNIIEDSETGEAYAKGTAGLDLAGMLRALFTMPPASAYQPISYPSQSVAGFGPTSMTVPGGTESSLPPLLSTHYIPPSPSPPTPAPAGGPITRLGSPSPAVSPPILPPTPISTPIIPITPPTSPVSIEEETKYPPFQPPETSPETDYKAEIQKIISGQPGTVKELMGREPEDLTQKFGKSGFINQLFAGAFAGLAGKDLTTEIEKAQLRVDRKFQQDFEMAKSKLSFKTQMDLKQLELMMAKDRETKDGQAKMWAALGESNPKRFMGDPKWWAMGMKANGMGDTAIRKWVQDQYDPATGKYSGLYMAPAQREWESRKFLMQELSKMFPGRSTGELYQMSTGQWPDAVKAKQEQLMLEHQTATPARQAEIKQLLYSIKHLQDTVPPGVYQEIDRLGKLGVEKGGIDKNTANTLKRTLALSEKLDKDIVGHILDTESREKVAAMGVTKAQPNYKQANALFAGAGSIPQIVLTINPGYKVGLYTGNEKIVTSYNTDVKNYTELMDMVKANAEPGAKKVDLPKGSNQELARFYSAQKRYMAERGYASVSTKLGGFTGDNLLVADHIITLIGKGAPPEAILEFLNKLKAK